MTATRSYARPVAYRAATRRRRRLRSRWRRLARTLVVLALAATVGLVLTGNHTTSGPWLSVHDDGVVLAHGSAPDGCDQGGAREAIAFAPSPGRLAMYYDGTGPLGWTACLATSADGVHWDALGRALPLGDAGSADAASAGSPWVVRDGSGWVMYYLATRAATPAPERVPELPYTTLEATSTSPLGPWQKTYQAPFTPTPGTWYSASASPGPVVQHGDTWYMYLSGSQLSGGRLERTVGVASAPSPAGPWTVSASPLLPPSQQVENAAVYHDPHSHWWFLFANHVGHAADGTAYADAVWVYWSRDGLHFTPQRRAVVIDAARSSWAHGGIGMPSVVARGKQLLLYYDGVPGNGIGHLGRDIALATIRLPLSPPSR